MMGRVLDDAAFTALADEHDRLLYSPGVQANLARLEALREEWQGRGDIPDAVREEVHTLQNDPASAEIAALQRRAERMRSERKFGGTAYTQKERFAGYRRLAGEVEARNTQHRLDMAPAERLAMPPWATEDVPRADQIAVGHDAAVTSPPEAPADSLLSHVDAAAGMVINHTKSGEHLCNAIDGMMDILDSRGLEVGWMDGGCRILAEALQGWSGGRITVGLTTKDNGAPSHAVGVLALAGKEGTACAMLDADGLASPAGLLQKLAELEHSPGERMLTLDATPDDLGDTLPMDDEAAGMTARALTLALGTFEQWEAGLHQELTPQAPGCHASVKPPSHDAAPAMPTL